MTAITTKPPKHILTGQRFGRLLVIAYLGRDTRKQPIWLTKCDCGTLSRKRASDLMGEGNKTRSCGCLRKEQTEKYHDILGKSRVISDMRKRNTPQPYHRFT